MSFEEVTPAQRAVCERYEVQPVPAPARLKVGVARNVRDGTLPLNGLRRNPVGDTTGWYIWAGGEPSGESDFFVPMHVSHLEQRCPDVLAYLALPPGSRFLIAPNHEDVWVDAKLRDQSS
jgi:hypothetical protein